MSDAEALNDDDVLEIAERWLKEGHSVALATVVRTWGSSPRQAGSQLAIREDSRFVGSVSGGCVEGAVVGEALDVIGLGEPRTLHFGVTDDEAWAVGLACGGEIDIFIEPVT
ncbi:MAG: XdhC family protein [Alphaproteobacteria bacterium]|nr:XdhC family protein [Alphaproteobacteria bacterium]